MPAHSGKLDKEQGFNALKIGALFSQVRSVLQKDTLNRKLSLEPNAQMVKYISRMYLADLKKPGYASFSGRKIDRIEVWFLPGEGNELAVSEVKLFFKKISDDDTNTFFQSVTKLYGSPASLGLDQPSKGLDTFTWYSEKVLMNGTTYYGDPVTEEPKPGYFKIEFESAEG